MSIAPPRGSPVGRPVPLASVAAEVEHAHAAIDHARGGYVWTSPPGGGKSTLLDLVRESTPSDETRVVVHLHPGAGTPGGTTEALVAQLAQHAAVPVPAHLARALARPSTGEQPGSACSAIVEYARTALPGTTLVLVVDDLDVLDPAGRTLLLYLVAHHQVSVVLLATATHAPWSVHLPYPLTVRRLQPLSPEEVLHLLEDRGHPPTAPRVAATLAHRLSGNTACILQTALELTDAQLAGTSSLPDPLPLVPALEALHGPTLARLDDADRRTLLVAAVSVVDRTDLLLAATGRTLDDVIDGPVAELLHMAGGRFTLVDPGLRSLVHGLASVAERTAAHLALAAAHHAAADEDAAPEGTGSEGTGSEAAGLEATAGPPTATPCATTPSTATWHTALGSLAGDPTLGPPLVDIAEQLLTSGDVLHAHEVAREAASQCAAGGATRAQLVAGVAALRSGHVLDADEWLQQVVRSGDAGLTARALAPYVTAVTLLTGCVPDDDVAQHLDRTLAGGDAAQRSALVDALGTTARLHAERGHRRAAADYLHRAHELLTTLDPSGTDPTPDTRSPAGAAHRRDLLDLDSAWCALFGVETTDLHGPALAPPDSHPDHQSSVRALRALEHVLDGDTETARSSLAGAGVAHAPVHADSMWRTAPGTDVSPLAEALLRTTKVLVELAAADLGSAADELTRAATHGPVDLPLAGIAVAAARRLAAFRDAGADRLATSLAASTPAPASGAVRREALVDSVLAAELAGTRREASAELELVAGPCAAPWDTVLPGASPGDGCRPTGIPPTGLAAGITAAALDHARRQLRAARAAVRGGDDAPVVHERFRAAADLFDACGADTWRDAAVRESEAAATPVPLTLGLRAARPAGDDPTAEPPPHWDGALTRRELDVALLVVQGASNRDVAGALHVSVRTVEVHLGRVFRKLGARSRVELTVLAHRGTRRVSARTS